MASVIIKTVPSLAVVLAGDTVCGRSYASRTIRTTSNAFEVGVSQRDCVAWVAFFEALPLLEEWFVTLDITGIAIKRAFSTTLTRCLAGLTLARDLVAVRSEGAFGLAVASVEEWVCTRLVAGQTDVSVLRLAFKTVILTWFACICARIVVCLSWTLFPAKLIVENSFASQNVAGLAAVRSRWSVIVIASLTRGFAVKGLGQAAAYPIDEEIVSCENSHDPRLGGHWHHNVDVEVSDHEEDPSARNNVVYEHVTHSDDVTIIHELAVNLKLQIG